MLRKPKSDFGLAMIVFGILWLVLGSVAYIFAISSQRYNEFLQVSPILLLCLIPGPVLAFLGVITLFLSSAKKPIKLHKLTDKYIWLKGICPEYLAELPKWPY